MLVVKVELWRHGNENDVTEIGRLYVINDGTGTKERGNYELYLCRRGTTERPPDGVYTGKGRIKDYPRKSYPAWELIRRGLNKLLKN